MSALKVYYDGLCPLCDREINHYKKIDHKKTIDFIDISSDDFDPKSEGLNPKNVQKKFHVKNSNNKVLTGVDAFAAIWKHLNIFKPLQFMTHNRFTRPFLDVGYNIFAFIRPIFRRKDCSSGSCKL